MSKGNRVQTNRRAPQGFTVFPQDDLPANIARDANFFSPRVEPEDRNQGAIPHRFQI
jgi:hypothetical protein